MTGKWGKAGQRLDDATAAQHARQAVRRRNQAKIVRQESDRVAYQLWRAGELRPYLITRALDAQGLYGPEVDQACGAREPDVDLWEAGKLYPTWTQLQLLADLVGVTPRFLCTPRELLTVVDTSLRFHGHRDWQEPLVLAYPPDVVAVTVSRPDAGQPNP